MGGKNHQPCNRFLIPSTRLSLQHSIAGIRLEEANVELERSLLSELGGHATSAHALLSKIESFKSALADVSVAITGLRESLAEENYADLPTIHSETMESVGGELSRQNLVSRPAWSKMLGIYRNGGFRKVLDSFNDNIAGLEGCAAALEDKIKGCEPSISQGHLENVLENNEPGNFRREFAKLYTAWDEFNREFLASSLISTEAYYQSQGTGSLLDEQMIPAAVTT